MRNNKIYILLILYSLVAAFVLFRFDGTGGPGDSVHHYLYAKYAPQHPELFFNHWAKPLHVFLASPFAQFGFIGIKIFNVIITLFTLFFTYKIAQKLSFKNKIIGPILLVFSPLCFSLTFSGLTEPLFALLISLGIYTILINKSIAASSVISFLPFVRSEGLIIIALFGLYFLIKKQWKSIPFLTLGHLAYSFAGYFVYHDLFWVFNQIPYAKLSSTYGSGKLTHFAVQMNYVVGIPVYVLFVIGVISILWKFIKKKLQLEIQVLIFLSFLAFFVAHTLFWHFGIFNSMGLKRVFVGVSPLIAIIALMGFNFISEEVLIHKKKLKKTFQGLILTSVLIFPFTSNPAALDWKTDLSLTPDQQLAKQVAQIVSTEKDSNTCFFYSQPYLSETLKLDHFDTNQRKALSSQYLNQIKSGDIVIWENWFAVVEEGVTQNTLEKDTSLIKLQDLHATGKNGEILFSVYKMK